MICGCRRGNGWRLCMVIAPGFFLGLQMDHDLARAVLALDKKTA